MPGGLDLGPEPPFRPAEALKVLADQGVRFVVIGAIAAAFQRAPFMTRDLDICPGQTASNLTRLDAAFEAMNGFREAIESLSARFPEREVWRYRTDHGYVDVIVRPSGTDGYEDLRKDAIVVEVQGRRIQLASLADVIRSREAAGRPKDAGTMDTLRRLLEEQQERGRKDR